MNGELNCVRSEITMVITQNSYERMIDYVLPDVQPSHRVEFQSLQLNDVDTAL
jgi:hypothetical protein